MKWIIDTDFSSNSQKAIEILLKNNLDIVAITVTYGPSYQKINLIKENIQEFLNKFNYKIPVYH